MKKKKARQGIIINEISLEDFLYNEEKVDEKKGKDSNNNTHDSIEKITDTSSEKSEEMEKQRSFSVGGKDSLNLSGKKYYEFYNLINSKNKFRNPFGEKWLEICEKIKHESLYGNFPSHDIKSFITKADDDLRQESLSMIYK